MRRAGTSRDYDDGSWPIFTYSFGPYWRASGAFKRGQVPQELAALMAGDAGAPDAGGMGWETVCYSQEFGRPGSDVWGGSQGVGDSFLCLDVADEHEESVRYLYTHVRAPRDGRWNLHVGAESGQVEQAWLNGTALLPDDSGEPVPAAIEVLLQEGAESSPTRLRAALRPAPAGVCSPAGAVDDPCARPCGGAADLVRRAFRTSV